MSKSTKVAATLLILGSMLSNANAWTSSCTELGSGFCKDTSGSYAADLEVLCDGDSNCSYTQRKCERKCKNTEGCTGYEYSDINKSCALKSPTLSDSVVENEYHTCYSCPWHEELTSSPTASPTTQPSEASQTCNWEYVGWGACLNSANNDPTTTQVECAVEDSCYMELEECQDACTAESSCAGIDYQGEFGACELILESLSASVDASETMSECYVCNEVVLKTCNWEYVGWGACLNSANNDPTTIQVECAADDSCYMELEECQDACAAESSCTGIEIQGEFGACELILENLSASVDASETMSECYVCNESRRRLRGESN